MLKEAMEFLFRSAETRAAEKAAENAKVKLLPEIPSFSDSERQVRCLLPGAKEITTIDIPPPLRDHTVDTVEDLLLACRRWAGTAGSSGVCWVDRQKVLLLLDDHERRERVTLPLRPSEGWQFLRALPKSFTQAELVLLLRRWKGRIAGAAELLSTVRRIKFRSSEHAESAIQHGNESLGRSVELELTGADAIPETLVFATPVFANLGLADEDDARSFGLLLSVDTANQRFGLEVMPEELERMMVAELDRIHSQIVDGVAELDVFFGRP